MGRNTTKYKKEIEPVWDEEKGWEKKLKQWVKRMSSFQQISHRNCRRYWEILSVSQELSINRQCCRRNTSEPGRWCYFFIIGATYDFFSNVLSSYFFLLQRIIMSNISLFTSLLSLRAALHWTRTKLLNHKPRWFDHSYLKIFITAV